MCETKRATADVIGRNSQRAWRTMGTRASSRTAGLAASEDREHLEPPTSEMAETEAKVEMAEMRRAETVSTAEREARVALRVLPEPVVKEEAVARPMEEPEALVGMAETATRTSRTAETAVMEAMAATVGTRSVEMAVLEEMVALPGEHLALAVLLQ